MSTKPAVSPTPVPEFSLPVTEFAIPVAEFAGPVAEFAVRSMSSLSGG
ncbi:MAG TPA: hypothetical protein VFG87_08095 [Amycolatopsis sp.]|nr:hypothetical protein [Amycolatopsis sp.]